MFWKNRKRLKVVNYFHKTLHLRCLTGLWICLCMILKGTFLALKSFRHFPKLVEIILKQWHLSWFNNINHIFEADKYFSFVDYDLYSQFFRLNSCLITRYSQGTNSSQVQHVELSTSATTIRANDYQRRI